MIVEQNFYVGFRDIDFEQELTNTGLLACLEDTAGVHSSKAGNLINAKHTWMLLQWKVQVIKRPKFNDTIRVETWSRKIEKFYAFRDFKVYNQRNEVIAIATSKWVYIDCEKEKIIKVPEEVGNAYETEGTFAFPENEANFSKLKVPKNYDQMIEFKITKNMIDTNHHLHNIYYLDIAEEVMQKENTFRTFEIVYKKEVKYGDIVKAYYTQENGEHIVVIKNQDENEVHAIISMKA